MKCGEIASVGSIGKCYVSLINRSREKYRVLSSSLAEHPKHLTDLYRSLFEYSCCLSHSKQWLSSNYDISRHRTENQRNWTRKLRQLVVVITITKQTIKRGTLDTSPPSITTIELAQRTLKACAEIGRQPVSGRGTKISVFLTASPTYQHTRTNTIPKVVGGSLCRLSFLSDEELS